MSALDGCDVIDCALQIVDDLGLNISKIGIFSRSWSEGKLGCGDPSDKVVYFSPTPRLRNISLNHSNKESGLEKRGDTLVRLLSKNQYPTEDLINAVSNDKEIEMYYFINNDLYEVVKVIENVTHWDVLVKRAKKRKLYL